MRPQLLSCVSVQSSLDFVALPSTHLCRPALRDSDWLFVGRFSGRAAFSHRWPRQNCPYLELAGWDLSAPGDKPPTPKSSGAPSSGTECVATGGLDQKIFIWNRGTALPVRPALNPGGDVLNLVATRDMPSY
ncbi:MAG: hypothetical protein U1G07_15760 [Verrucomicrobiota bacterium]